MIDRPFAPIAPVGSTFTFDAVEDTGSKLTSNVSFIKTLARASPKNDFPGY